MTRAGTWTALRFDLSGPFCTCRHLNESQRAMVGQALLKPFEDDAKKRQATSGPGIYGGKPVVENLPQAVESKKASEEVAKIVNVSPRLVRDAAIQDEANRKRAEAAREQHEVSNPRVGEQKPILVEQQSVATPKMKHPEYKAKATASKTNPGAVARGDKLAKERQCFHFLTKNLWKTLSKKMHPE